MYILFFGQTEVSDLVESILDENIWRFEIAVDDVEFSKIFETFAYLPQHLQNLLFFLLLFFFFAAIQQISEVSSATVLGHYVEIAIVLDVWVVTWKAS